jgi:hypothetical protein
MSEDLLTTGFWIAAAAAVIVALLLRGRRQTIQRSPVESGLQVALGLALAASLVCGALALLDWPRDYVDTEVQSNLDDQLTVVDRLCRTPRPSRTHEEGAFRKAVDRLANIVREHGDEWSESGVAASLDQRVRDLFHGWAGTFDRGECDGPPGTGAYLVRVERGL